MAKTLKDFLEGYLKVKSADEQKFIDKHVTAKNPDRNGNGDDVFKGSTKAIDRRKDRKGYNPGEDEKVYEAVETERVKHPVGQRPKGPGWVLKQAGEQTGKDHNVWERKFKRVNEALKGNQHKIDANKNGKVDAHDFKLLRGKKKVAEAVEELEELSHDTLRRYRMKSKSIADNEGPLNYREKGRELAGRKTYGGRMAGIEKAKVMAKEEAEQIDELSIDTMKSYGDKRARTAFSGGRKPGQSVDAGIKMKSKQSNSLSLARTKINRVRDTGSTVLNKEEAEQIDETAKIVAHLQKRYGDNIRKSHVRSAANDFGVDASKLAKAVRTKLGKNMLDEKLNMDKASMGDVIKDFQDSNAPQFKGKSQAKRRVMAIAAKLTAERGGKPLNKEERLQNLLANISESHQRVMLEVFDKLNEDNKSKFLEACSTPMVSIRCLTLLSDTEVNNGCYNF
jgi:hypothetical protein